MQGQETGRRMKSAPWPQHSIDVLKKAIDIQLDGDGPVVFQREIAIVGLWAGTDEPIICTGNKLYHIRDDGSFTEIDWHAA